MERMRMESMDIVAKNVEKIEKLFPDCITEARDENGKLQKVVDRDKLLQKFSHKIIGGGTAEHYEFTWVGKKSAKIEANRPIRKTLRPCIEESKDWNNTENLYIEGDNLEVLKLLQNSYRSKVKMIYIDPPYNTGNDFIYVDDFAQNIDKYEEAKGSFDEEGNRLFKNTDTNGRFHSDWCSMIYPRLILARNLLADDGVIFISIDDSEQENLKKICNEIFGENNFVGIFIWKKKQGGGNDSNNVVVEHEYILAFSKNIANLRFNLDKNYKLSDNLYPYKDNFGEYGLITLDKASIQFSKSLVYEIKDRDGNSYFPRVVKGKQSCWRWSKLKVEKEFDKLVFKNGKVYTKYYRPEGVTPKSLLIDSIYGRTESGNDDIKLLFKVKPFNYPKPIALIKHFLSIGSKQYDIILDFFSGSATTAHAVMQLNAEDGGKRKFIMVQLPEKTDEKSVAFKDGYKNICEIGKERIRRAGEKIKEEAGLNGQDLDIGFRVLKLDDSNMKDVYYSIDEYDQQMLSNLEENIKKDRTDLDLLFGCLLDWGVELDKPYITKDINGHKVHIYNDGDLVACFEKDLDMETIDEIAKLQALRVVFRDSCFIDTPSKINVAERFKMIAPDTEIKVI